MRLEEITLMMILSTDRWQFYKDLATTMWPDTDGTDSRIGPMLRKMESMGFVEKSEDGKHYRKTELGRRNYTPMSF